MPTKKCPRCNGEGTISEYLKTVGYDKKGVRIESVQVVKRVCPICGGNREICDG